MLAAGARGPVGVNADVGIVDVDVAAALKDGRAMDKWRDVIRAQGGDPDAALPVAKETHTVAQNVDT